MMTLPLVERYRPKTFSEVLGVSDLDKLIKLIATPKEMPSIMLYGPQGTGKTTVAKIILENLQPIDYIRVNGSDTTGVDTIRERVYNFMTSMSTQPDKPKIIWIEEFDFMSANAFAALRSMIEQYQSNARFIVTLNYLHKIPEPIQSRFSKFEFKKPADTHIVSLLNLICSIEKITAETDVLVEIAKISAGDFRTAINTLQQLSANETKTILATDIGINKPLAEEVYRYIQEKRWTDIRYKIPDQNPDYAKLLIELDKMYFNSDLPTSKKADINEIISAGMAEMNLSFDEHISFAAICSRIMKAV